VKNVELLVAVPGFQSAQESVARLVQTSPARRNLHLEERDARPGVSQESPDRNQIVRRLPVFTIFGAVPFAVAYLVVSQRNTTAG
jgi:hypothetical protein